MDAMTWFLCLMTLYIEWIVKYATGYKHGAGDRDRGRGHVDKEQYYIYATLKNVVII